MVYILLLIYFFEIILAGKITLRPESKNQEITDIAPRLFNIFINDIGKRIECNLRQLTNDTKLSGAIEMPEV